MNAIPNFFITLLALKQSGILVGTLLVLNQSSLLATTAEQHQIVPDRFQGEWHSDLENCGTLAEGGLQMEADRIQFYESTGSIVSVVTQGQSDLALTSELSGEGETWLAQHHFRLSEDGNSLSAIVYGNPSLTRYRCPRSDG